jgi:DNA helicase-2/ATP-dependent DNA helicase PcrA
MPDYEKELDSQQLQAVMKGPGPALVIAGPGSGKTRTIIYRICRLIEGGTNPDSILLLTFTNKAAREMKDRARKLIGQKAGNITAGTFHHFANLILRRHSHAAGIRPNFSILDAQDSMKILKKTVLQVAGEGTKKGIISLVARAISLSKLRRKDISAIISSDPDFAGFRGRYEEMIAEIADKYSSMKQRRNCLDFDDLLFLCQKMLEDNPGIAEHYREKYQHILVDEFQDTDRLQASIIKSLYCDGKDLMVVGDDFQSIYSFRGADIGNIINFKNSFGAMVIRIESNYRSKKPIVNMINACMEKSQSGLRKKLSSSLGSGSLPNIIPASNRAEEAWAIANMIEEDIAQKRKAGVLFRAAHFSSELETELSRRKIPYELRGGIKFFEQKHIKDMVSLLRAFENPEDSEGVERLLMLFDGIGSKKAERTAEGLTKWQEILRRLSRIQGIHGYAGMLDAIFSQSANAAGMLSSFYEEFYSGYMEKNFENWEEREADIEALIGSASKYELVCDFLSSFQLDALSPEDEEKKVILSTIHQSKGLEWDSVYLICAADGMLPISRSNDLEEERRLFYVAISRARSRLIMSYPSLSGRFYSEEELSPSRFIEELPDNCFEEK